MNSSHSLPASPADIVTSDFIALASHMSSCDRSGDGRFKFHMWLDDLHQIAAPRIVTAACCLTLMGLTLTWLS